MSRPRQSGPTADRPTCPVQGERYFDTDLGNSVEWDGSAWNSLGGGGGSSCLDGIMVYDNAGGTPITGAQIPMDTTMLNTDGTNYALSSVVAGAVTILNDGDYLIRVTMAVNDPAAFGHGAWQSVIQTTTSGLGAWANVIGADGYTAGHRQILMMGGVVAAQSEAFVTVSGGGGLDVQLVGNVIAASGAETTFAQGSRLSVMRVC